MGRGAVSWIADPLDAGPDPENDKSRSRRVGKSFCLSSQNGGHWLGADLAGYLGVTYEAQVSKYKQFSVDTTHPFKILFRFPAKRHGEVGEM